MRDQGSPGSWSTGHRQHAAGSLWCDVNHAIPHHLADPLRIVLSSTLCPHRQGPKPRPYGQGRSDPPAVRPYAVPGSFSTGPRVVVASNLAETSGDRSIGSHGYVGTHRFSGYASGQCTAGSAMRFLQPSQYGRPLSRSLHHDATRAVGRWPTSPRWVYLPHTAISGSPGPQLGISSLIPPSLVLSHRRTR